MRDLNEFFGSQVDRTLYHYTGVGSLLGIVQNRQVWASHAYYLNDSKEILHACSVLRDVALKGAVDRPEGEQDFLTQLSLWLNSFEQTVFNIYVFSLSETPSLLSQWRSYTPHGKGVSLGFSAATLDSMLQVNGFRIAKCRYSDREHRELLGAMLEKLLLTFRQRREKLDEEQCHPTRRYFSFLETHREHFLQVLLIIKHPSFSEEAEWRLISPYYENYVMPDIHYREGASMLLPYIHLKLPGHGRLFDAVLLGPSQDVNLSMSALHKFLSQQHVCTETIWCGIPFRKW